MVNYWNTFGTCLYLYQHDLVGQGKVPKQFLLVWIHLLACLTVNYQNPIQPFTSSPDNLIYICITTWSSQEELGYAFVVHSSALLCHAKEDDFDILWKVWGPTATLLVGCGYMLAEFCAQQLLVHNGEIWNFNQYWVKWLGKGFAVETELACISIIAEEEKMGLDVIYSLPYVRIMLKQLPPLRYGTFVSGWWPHISSQYLSF